MEYKIYTSSTILEFGRYKGKIFAEVMREDIEYMKWFIREIDNVVLWDKEEEYMYRFDEELRDIISSREKIYKENSEYYEDDYEEDDYEDEYYEDEPYYTNDEDMWADIAGSDDPEDIETAYWNLD